MQRWLAFFLLACLAIPVFAAPFDGVTCDDSDVTLAEQQYATMQRLYNHPVGQVVSLTELWESELMVAWARYCAGRLDRASYCQAANTYFTRIQGVIERLRAARAGETGTIQEYVRAKLLYGAPCR